VSIGGFGRHRISIFDGLFKVVFNKVTYHMGVAPIGS